MRVLVDAHMVGSRETGNETYVANLLPELVQLPGVDCAACVVPGNNLPAHLNRRRVELLPLCPSGNWSRLAYTLPAMCRRWRADILHVTYIGPFYLYCPLVVSVHDVSFKHYPEFFSARDRLLFKTLLPFTLRRASAVLTISQHAKQEILKSFPFLAGKVDAILLASNPLFRPINETKLLQQVRSRYGIRSQFILAVGNLQPRKNLLRLISAFASLRRQMDSVQLVVAGQAQWQSSAIYTQIKRLGVEDNVVFTGYASVEDLVLLYNAADVFVYPSIYEGFGLPVLEAMACGTPVITSNTSSIPEVAGEAALLIDPYIEEQIAQAIHQILTNPDLALSLSEKGFTQVKKFSWLNTARETLKVYQSVFDD